MRKPRQYTFQSPAGRITFFGRGSPRGVYVLRIRVTRAEEVVFRRRAKEGGMPIVLQPGEYVYVGSARAEKGPLSLAGRLLRHASGITRPSPHPIRRLMLEAFETAALALLDDDGPRLKSGGWNVDYLLDRPSVELVEAFAIRSPLDWKTWKGGRTKAEQDKLNQRCTEFRVADILVGEPGAVVFDPGLGAADHRGGTHLFRMDAGEDWWRQTVPARVAHALLLEQLRYIHQPALDSLPWPVPLTARQAVTAGNMHPVRGGDVLRRMAGGQSFGRAERQTGQDGVFDTLGWGEVVNRLRMGSGRMLKVAAVLDGYGKRRLRSPDQRHELSELAAELKSAAGRLMNLVRESAKSAGVKSSPPQMQVRAAATDQAGGEVAEFSELRRDVRKTLTDVRKNERDVPRLAEHNYKGVVPTALEVEAAVRHLQLIERSAARVELAVQDADNLQRACRAGRCGS